MTPYQACRDEWERNTSPNHRLHRLGKWHEEFRRYGNAEAWLEWNNEAERIAQITKLETPPESQHQGAATQLIEFLKSLADKHDITLFGNATAYNSEKQTELEAWYEKRGFKLYKSPACPTMIWYPLKPATS